MDFIKNWHEQMAQSLAECAQLTAPGQETHLELALLATGTLWPLRQPVQEFDMVVIRAINLMLGAKAKYILRTVQGWENDDITKTAQELAPQLKTRPELAEAINLIVDQFGSRPIFEKQRTPAVEKTAGAGDSPSSPAPLEGGAAPRVFVSYARSDGEDMARELRQRLEQEGIPVWQDRVKMVGGRDWWLQITDALDEVEFMALIATPGAVQSAVVRKEWSYARQQGVCVYPVKGAVALPLDMVPRWMRSVHFYDLDQEWSTLVEDLKAPCQTPRVPFMVEDLSDEFVPRTQPLAQLKRRLLNQQGEPAVIKLGLYGTGGFGKTLLVRAVCHDEDIRRAFDDGILWVTLGENPGDLTQRLVDLIEVLTGERPAFADLDAAQTHLSKLLANRNVLVILDDVWDDNHLQPFTQSARRCTQLITTRNQNLLPQAAQAVEIAAMQQDEAVALLSRGLPEGSRHVLRALAGRLGGWPLLLSLTNGTLRDRVTNNRQPLPAALAYVNKALDKRGLTAFESRSAAARNRAVSQTLGVSQDLLDEQEQARYEELAIFPSDVLLPLSVLHTLWQATGGLTLAQAEAFCLRLQQLSLLASYDSNSQVVQIHNIVRKYLAQKHAARLPGLHCQLLDAYAARLPTGSGAPWSRLPHDETYLWTHLAYHLVEAGRAAALAETVADFSYLVTKTFLHSANAAEADLLAARKIVSDDTSLARLHQAFSQSSHLLNGCKSLPEITSTLHARMLHFPTVNQLINHTDLTRLKPLITAAQRLPDLPDPSLIRTLVGHSAVVLGCDITANGAILVSIDQEGGVKIWDTKTGAERLTLGGHQIMGNGCAISSDGAVIASAAWDGLLKIWNGSTGRERFSIEAHAAPVFDCALSADGSVAVSASKDATLKVWDALTGIQRATLTGYDRSVTGCDISADGKLIISNSSEGTVKLWDAVEGTLLTTLRQARDEISSPVTSLTFTAVSSALLSCAISSDGKTAVAALPDYRLRVWDVPSGRERCTLVGHTGWVEGCALSADGSLVVSVANDKTIKVWRTEDGENLYTIEGHNRTVTRCAVCANGSIIASASQDKTLKLWDAHFRATQTVNSRFNFSSRSCAVSRKNGVAVFGAPGNLVKVVDTATGDEKFSFKGHTRPVTGCSVSADGRLVATASQDRTVKLWDLSSGTQFRTLRGHTWTVSDCALDAAGNTVVSASDDSTLKVWDVATGAERFTLSGHNRGINGCAISGARLVSASADNSLRVWDIRSGEVQLVLTGHSAPVNGCTFSPDGRLVASASSDESIKLWDSQTGDNLQTLVGHASSVLAAVFHPDNNHLLSVSRDKTIKLWNFRTQTCVTTLRVDGSLSSCAWYPDGQQIIATGSRGVYFLKLLW